MYPRDPSTLKDQGILTAKDLLDLWTQKGPGLWKVRGPGIPRATDLDIRKGISLGIPKVKGQGIQATTDQGTKGRGTKTMKGDTKEGKGHISKIMVGRGLITPSTTEMTDNKGTITKSFVLTRVGETLMAIKITQVTTGGMVQAKEGLIEVDIEVTIGLEVPAIMVTGHLPIGRIAMKRGKIR